MLLRWHSIRPTWSCTYRKSYPQVKRFSILTGSSAERIHLQRQSHTNITLDVYHPVAGPPAPNGTKTAVIYLPRGPLYADPEHESATLSLLRSALPCPIVQVNYRFDRTAPFPTAIHDVLAGYDWVVEHLLPPSGPSPSRSGVAVARAPARVAVCGEFVGGGLASALALSECRIGSSVGIVGAAVNNAVVDWVGVDGDTGGSSGAREKAKPVSVMQELSRLRDRCFVKPEHYFDPFASPILFFRASGKDIPPAPAPLPQDDMDTLSLLEREAFYRERLSLNLAAAEQSPERKDLREEDGQPAGTPKKRKSSLRFPSPSSGLRLPPFRISAGIESVLSEQAAELTHVLRQSFARNSRHNITREFGRKVLLEDELVDDEELLRAKQMAQAEAEEKAQLGFHPGLGLWDGTPAGRTRVSEAAEWLMARLGQV